MNATLATSLAPLATRVRFRTVLEWARRGLLVGLAGASVLAAAGRLLDRPEWPLAAALWLALAMLVALGIALARLPDTWRVARVADGLGLAERATSALHASRIGHPLAPLLSRDADQALARLDPAACPLFPTPRRWAPVIPALLVLALVALAPLPGRVQSRSADAGATAAARQSVDALRVKLAPVATPAPLARETDAELRALDAQLAQARDAAAAAREIEQAEERITSKTSPDDYAARRALDRLAAAWSDQPALGTLSRALAAGDSASTRQALADLARTAPTLSPARRQSLQVAFQQGANASRDDPALAGALRQAASSLAAGSDAANGSDGNTAAALNGSNGNATAGLNAVATALDDATARAAGLAAAQQAIDGLGQARAELGSGASGVAGASASGPPSGSASGGAAGTSLASGAGATGSGTGGSGASGASGNRPGVGNGGASSDAGAGASAGSAGGPGGNGGASQSGPGASGSASGSGAGGAGGSGAGAGIGSSGSGQPGAPNAGPALGGGSGAPSNVAPTTYDPIYAPRHLGGGPGPTIQAPADPTGARGDTVEVPNAPLASGAVRPYDQVYGQYAAEARESLARQPLPPALQGLVQRYFSAIAPNN